MSRALGCIAALLVVSLVTACARNVTIAHMYRYDNYTFTTLSQPARQGGMWVDIVGNPFNAPQGEVNAVVEYALTNQRFGPEFPVMADPPPDLSRVYRVLLIFSPAINADLYYMCRDRDQPRDETKSGVALIIAFCEGRRTMTSLRATIPEASGPDDPRFRTMMRQVSVNLFPPIPEKRGRDDDIIP